jgi:hypothetical protein
MMEAPTEPTDIPNWQAAAHPSASLVAEQSGRALDRQLAHLDSLDTKASYLAAANVVVIGALLSALAAHPVHDAHLQDVATAALAAGLGGLAASVYTWWPRQVNAPPRPGGLRAYFNSVASEALLDLCNEISGAFDDNKRVENRKLQGIRFASGLLFATVLLATVVGYVAIVLGR